MHESESVGVIPACDGGLVRGALTDVCGLAVGASHFGWHAQAVGAGMFTKSAFSMAALRLAMTPDAGIATVFGMHPLAVAAGRCDGWMVGAW